MIDEDMEIPRLGWTVVAMAVVCLLVSAWDAVFGTATHRNPRQRRKSAA